MNERLFETESSEPNEVNDRTAEPFAHPARRSGEFPRRPEQPPLRLGICTPLGGARADRPLFVPTRHLTTHGVIVGMTGSGKTGLVTVFAEEALDAGVPTILFDIKGDLSNLLLNFPSARDERVASWIAGPETPSSEIERLVEERRVTLEGWGFDDSSLADFLARTRFRILTPGSNAGEPLHVLSSLERRSPRWDTDPEVAQEALRNAITLVLRLLGRDADPAKSREHIFLSTLAERRHRANEETTLPSLMADILEPPIDSIGHLPLETYLKKSERTALAVALNNLLASPTFATWRTGSSLDLEEWTSRTDGRTPGIIVSVAHLDDEERQLVLGLVLEDLLAWVRGLPGTDKLKALVVFDEVYGFLPPHPKNPPTKRPLVALLKQARAFGVGILVATQNPMDLDYRALSNAGLWCVGRLQTDADRSRVVDGLTAAGVTGTQSELNQTLSRLAPRWFVTRNAHTADGNVLLHPRQTRSLLRGPLTRSDLKKVRRTSGS